MALAGGAVIVAVVLGRQLQWTEFPADWGVTWADWVNDAVTWVRDHWRAQTKWLNEFLVRDVHVRISSWLKQSNQQTSVNVLLGGYVGAQKAIQASGNTAIVTQITGVSLY